MNLFAFIERIKEALETNDIGAIVVEIEQIKQEAVEAFKQRRL